jgi:dTDP-4-amino-4,6-dideoxygalactose transaminase
LAAGVGPGDEVITVPFTFVATVAAIDYTGAKPVLVDIQPDTLTMDPQAFEAAITPKTKAVIPVHLYGLPADMDAIVAIARRHNLVVIEDAAQAHGAQLGQRRVGSLGDMACFSFYPGKNLGAYGEGGMVVTDNAEWVRKLRMLRDWGAEKKYHHEIKGFNFRLEGIQGAVLRVKLRHLERWTEARRALARQYDEVFQEVNLPRQVTPPGYRHVYHVYAVRSAQRAQWQEALLTQGIQTGIHYPTPVHLLPAFADLGHKVGDFPHAEQAASQVLSLPMFPELTPIQCETVAQAVAQLAAPSRRRAPAPTTMAMAA